MHLSLRAPAKINLHLDVLHRRADGFHELETVFQAIDLADALTIDWDADAPDGIALRCAAPGIPTGPENLVWRAAAAFRAATGLRGHLAITLEKQVPHGAGLGGGSADAGAVLRALARCAPLADERLAAIALALGSDVPFFLIGGTAHALGRGEILTPLPDLPPTPLTLLLPEGAHLPTPAVFGALTEAERGPRPALGAAAWAARLRGGNLAAALGNRLTDAAVRLCPPVGAVLARLRALGVPHAMTGSGCACVALGHVAGWPGVRAIATRTLPRAA